MEKTAYEILGVSPNASDQEIKKAYHTLVRNVHSDVTDLKDLTPEERKKYDELIREYTGAYGKISKGKRAEYDRTLNLRKGSAKVNKSSNGNQSFAQGFDQLFDQLFQDVFVRGYSFYGSKTTSPDEKRKQEYFRLKSKKEALEKKLRNLQWEEGQKQRENSSVNPLQIEMDIRVIHSSINELEIKKQNEITFVQMDYTSKMNKPLVTKRKKEQLQDEMNAKITQINANYQALIEEKKAQIIELERKIKEQEETKNEAIENNPEIRKTKASIEQIKIKLDELAQQLGYQTQTASYQSSHATYK